MCVLLSPARVLSPAPVYVYALMCFGRNGKSKNIALFCVACAVSQAKSYASGCTVSACNAGWKVSDDNSQCLANVCSCSNGVKASGAACVTDGAKMCASCNNGFKLRLDKTACEGRSLVRG